MFESGDELGRGGASASELARFFPVPSLPVVGDEIADGAFDIRPGFERPIALFDAARVDYSLRRLVHYTGSDWRAMQPWVLLTNYHRYVDQFIRWGLEQLRIGGRREDRAARQRRRSTRRRRRRRPRRGRRPSSGTASRCPPITSCAPTGAGVSLVNIGVGPANAKTITDHIAVLRPHCWLMVGHCAGLRQSQLIGDYVLAHAYLRQDKILDDAVPLDMPIPALAEVQVALQEAVARVTGDRGEPLKRRLRTGTVVTNDDRNWELRWTQERRRINLSRAVAVDMESATIATQGFRMRVPYGTLLCVSDKPLHGEIKLPGAANAFYERAIGEHLQIGIAALELLQNAARDAAFAQIAQLRRAAVPLRRQRGGAEGAAKSRRRSPCESPCSVAGSNVTSWGHSRDPSHEDRTNPRSQGDVFVARRRRVAWPADDDHAPRRACRHARPHRRGAANLPSNRKRVSPIFCCRFPVASNSNAILRPCAELTCEPWVSA